MCDDATDDLPRMSPAPKRPPIAILIAVSAAGPMALNILIPSMPGMRAAFDTDYGTKKFTIADPDGNELGFVDHVA